MDLREFHSGTYEDRYQYRSFLPSKVCHDWIVSDARIIQLLGEADRAIGELNAFSQLIPDIDMFVRAYVVKEATQSSRIEGTQTTMEDAFKRADEIALEARDDWGEVQNYIDATHYAVDRLSALPISGRLIRETHRVLMQGVRGEHKLPGEFRRSQNWIGVSLRDAVFVPPHHEHVPELMGDLEAFLNSPEILVPPLIKIAIAHYQFETIHPFLDGNGRVGRLMVSLFLTSEGLLQKPALYLSDYFEKHKAEYIDHLMSVRQTNNLREWLVFFLFGVEQTARSSIQSFKNIIELKSRIEREVLPTFSTRRQANAQALMFILYQKPIIDVAEAQEYLGTSQNTAASLVSDFVRHGVLREITGRKRNRLFVFADYIALLR